jgi:hypothetical protein
MKWMRGRATRQCEQTPGEELEAAHAPRTARVTKKRGEADADAVEEAEAAKKAKKKKKHKIVHPRARPSPVKWLSPW